MITHSEFAQRAHEVTIELLVGELLLGIGIALMRVASGYIQRGDPAMVRARQMAKYRWN